MKQILVATLLSVLLAGAYYQSQIENKNDFETWSQQYGKIYPDEERIYRQSIYNENKRMIEDHNNHESRSYKMGENQFMTLTREEFIELYMNKVEIPHQDSIIIDSDQILEAVDWRNSTTVKNQGSSCNAGWAFSVASNIEAWYKIVKKLNITASPQQLIDCDQYSYGCSGGVNLNGFSFVNYTRGIADGNKYPYVGYKQACKTTAGYYAINGYTEVGSFQSNLQYYLQYYPVSVGVDASNWQFYKSGLFGNCSSSGNSTHYVLAVGFDNSSNWILQNSFGTSWGENGYIRLYPNNTCGVLNMPYQIY